MALKSVIIKGNGIRKEAVANGSITPGHLLVLESTGKVAVHGTAGGNQNAIFAHEDDLQGNGIDTVYANSVTVQYNAFKKGEEVNALLANGETVVIGDFLESNGDGTLRLHVPQTETIGLDSSANLTTFLPLRIVGVAQDALDLSDSSGADPDSSRIRVEIS